MTDNSRTTIFKNLHSSHHGDFPIPEIPDFEIPGNPIENFTSNLKSFDGNVMAFAARSDVMKWLQENVSRDGKNVFSSISDFTGNFPIEKVDDPHNAHSIDICIGEGLLGVGETGSVWVTDSSLGKAACALMSTDLYLLLDISKIVPGMHQAYNLINLRDNPYGSFFSGPSATADIEAVRVTGAQGEISLTVLLYS